jgi:hypothetical protein
MEKDKIFFGEQGLTSTSAQFISNLCKEAYSTAEMQLNSLKLYTTKVKLLGSPEESLIETGRSTVLDIKSILKDIGDYKAMIAWLREGISAKERLVKEAKTMTYSDFGIEVPKRPEEPSYIEDDDVIATWSIKQRCRYYYLEACCATIGQYIHPKGTFAVEREALKKVMSAPNEVSGSGRDTLIYTREPSVELEEVENTYMNLQQTYRQYQAELNSMKHEIQTTVLKTNTEFNQRYMAELNKYNTLMDIARPELQVKINEAVATASNLKILIPDALKHTYEEVQNLGKKK